MKWKIINEKYTDFLRNNYEPRIPYTNYGKDKFKPFFGELFQVDDLIYVTQVTSPKPRHNKLKNSIDFHKIYINNTLISCVNLNYMFPVPICELSDLQYGKIDELITFETKTQKNNYINLLKIELAEINKLSLEQFAMELYHRKYDFPDDFISKRCFDFLNLENAAHEWLQSDKAKSSEPLLSVSVSPEN